MTVRKNYRHQTLTVSCDECGDDHEVDTEDFREAIADFKEAGGAVRQEDGEWRHLCADCA